MRINPATVCFQASNGETFRVYIEATQVGPTFRYDVNMFQATQNGTETMLKPVSEAEYIAACKATKQAPKIITLNQKGE